jgi:hypothetical protein
VASEPYNLIAVSHFSRSAESGPLLARICLPIKPRAQTNISAARATRACVGRASWASRNQASGWKCGLSISASYEISIIGNEKDATVLEIQERLPIAVADGESVGFP